MINAREVQKDWKSRVMLVLQFVVGARGVKRRLGRTKMGEQSQNLPLLMLCSMLGGRCPLRPADGQCRTCAMRTAGLPSRCRPGKALRRPTDTECYRGRMHTGVMWLWRRRPNLFTLSR